MTTKLIVAEPDSTLRQIQLLMRDNKISGVPIVDVDRLIGMVSVDDIIRALDQNYIDSPVMAHMSRKVVCLEDDMPLSFGITYFDKYKFGRFPVLDKARNLVGIVTSRDITVGLLMEMNRTFEQMEQELNQPNRVEPEGHFTREFLIRRFDYENAGRASTEIKRILGQRGVDKKLQRSVAVASYELEMNLINHSDGGRLIFHVSPEEAVVKSLDQGPGIADLDLAMTEGWSTANDWIRSLGFGAGMGLPNVKRVSDNFVIESDLGKGTQVEATIRLIPPGKNA